MSIDDVVAIAALLLELDEQTVANATELGLLDSALHAPFAGYGDTDLYPETWQRCAVLGSRIIGNHPFPDGNKRVAFLSMRAFARLNGHRWEPGDDAGLVIEAFAAHEMTEDVFTDWVRSGWRDSL